MYQGSRAKVLYQDAPTDGETVDTLLDDDDELVPTAKEEGDLGDLPELDDLPEDPEEGDGEDDFVEGSPRFEQFRSDFTKAFGLPL